MIMTAHMLEKGSFVHCSLRRKLLASQAARKDDCGRVMAAFPTPQNRRHLDQTRARPIWLWLCSGKEHTGYVGGDPGRPR
jgi:hypothetical protein